MRSPIYGGLPLGLDALPLLEGQVADLGLAGDVVFAGVADGPAEEHRLGLAHHRDRVAEARLRVVAGELDYLHARG